jgi:hypothetical protein
MSPTREFIRRHLLIALSSQDACMTPPAGPTVWRRVRCQVQAAATVTAAEEWPVQRRREHGRRTSSAGVSMRGHESKEARTLPSPLEHRRGKLRTASEAGPVRLVLAALLHCAEVP